MEEKTPVITADESKEKRFHVLVTDAGTGEALVDAVSFLKLATECVPDEAEDADV